MRFDLVTLNLVLAIADTRSITRGAEREHLALAAASKRLSDLESRLGITLFERRARGVEITAAGRALVHHIRNLQTTLHALESEVAEFAQGIQGQLRVVANASAIAEFLPSDLARFSKAHPGIRVSLEDRTSAEIQQLIAEGEADVGIFTGPVIEPRIRCWPYQTGRLGVIVPKHHGLARMESVKFADLLDEDLVGVHAGAAVQHLLHDQAKSLGKPLRNRLQVRGFDAIAQLVEADLGVSVIPALVAQRLEKLFAIRYIPLDEPWAEREHVLAVKPQEVLPNAVKRFVETVCPAARASLRSHLAPRG